MSNNISKVSQTEKTFKSISRKNFLKSLGLAAVSIAAGGFGFKYLKSPKPRRFSGKIIGGDSNWGHLLRTPPEITPTKVVNVNTVIVGGGISGLSAGWWLAKKGHKDFKILEMNSFLGGNSACGENSISKYPWGAHYVPIPGPDAHYVREFFEECGIITGYKDQKPVFNEYFLCADPHERLFFQGQWHDNLIPQRGISDLERTQYDGFFSFVENLKNQKGSDHRPLFTVPIALSSQDPLWLELDKISMADFMKSKGWDSQHLNWYVNYCCRDDFGMPHHKVSAWAGLHYFAARAGVAHNADSQAIVTWPEGNGFLVDRYRDKIGSHVIGHSLVYKIESKETKATIDVINFADKSTTRYVAKNVIYAGPKFTASRVITDYQYSWKQAYSPWLVANVSVNEMPTEKGQAISWDNVSYYSNSLGYISATHQNLKTHRRENVLTYYLPLDHLSPQEERKAAQLKTHVEWSQLVQSDLEKIHPGISAFITNLDVWIWGHGMISPGIDSLWNKQRQINLHSFKNIEFANSDMSGISIFEEAQYHGVEAAKRVLLKEKA